MGPRPGESAGVCPGRQVGAGAYRASLCECVFGVRGAPGRVLECMEPEGGERLSVVILEPGGPPEGWRGPRGLHGQQSAAERGLGLWVRVKDGAGGGRDWGCPPRAARRGGALADRSRRESGETVSVGCVRGCGAPGPPVGGKGSAIARPARAPRPGSASPGAEGGAGAGPTQLGALLSRPGTWERSGAHFRGF